MIASLRLCLDTAVRGHVPLQRLAVVFAASCLVRLARGALLVILLKASLFGQDLDQLELDCLWVVILCDQ